ncbi:MAG: HPr family phosphocarrier protein [Acidobacteriota bacterium]|nr:HPr family phosphocarrier protein [Acidobacteriota bacterium]
MPERTISIRNQLGFHARAASRFVDLASSFRSRIEIRMNGVAVDGKSILGILTLAAPCGASVRLVAEGLDAEEALDRLVELIERRFGEEH